MERRSDQITFSSFLIEPGFPAFACVMYPSHVPEVWAEWYVASGTWQLFSFLSYPSLLLVLNKKALHDERDNNTTTSRRTWPKPFAWSRERSNLRCIEANRATFLTESITQPKLNRITLCGGLHNTRAKHYKGLSRRLQSRLLLDLYLREAHAKLQDSSVRQLREVRISPSKRWKED